MPKFMISSRLFIALLVSMLLVACGGSSRDDPADPAPQPDPVATQEIVVSPSLGRINRGIARAFALNGDALSDAVTVGDDGTATLEIPATHDEPLLVEVVGADDADYFDESANTTLPFPADQSLRALLPGPRDGVGVSILTELAVILAEAAGETIDLELIEIANERIRAALAADVADLLTPPVIVDGATAAGMLSDDDAGRLAARLGALAMLAEGAATPALTILRQLAEDIADGTIDGVGLQGVIEDLVYDRVTFAADFLAAIQAFAAAFGTEELQAHAASVTPPLTAIGRATRPGATQSATINPDLVGDYLLTYFEAAAGGPFTEGETVMVIVGADNTLRVGELQLEDPFHFVQDDGFVFESEINWRDEATGVIYALSLNDTGVFNEINVGDGNQIQQNGFPLFLGQLFEDEGEAGDEIGATTTDPNLIVRASFEGLEAGKLQGQADGAGDMGWDEQAWLDLSFDVERPEVVDTSANPLIYAFSDGSTLHGGDRALKFFGQGQQSSPSSAGGRPFEETFDDTFFMAFLVRVDNIPSGFSVSSTLALRPNSFGGDTINVGIRFTGFSARLATDIGVQMGFGPAIEVGETYLVVTRLAKAGGSTRFNRMDIWVNPPSMDVPPDEPDLTLQESSSQQPTRLDQLRLQNEGQPTQIMLYDEIRFAGSWAGLFQEP
ncbi:MAG: hypothetical protein JJU22_01460 [Gammaproteobacteria bacterium]|nr:hypothetical protein [Gammaproteobacteria bacterium]